MPGHERGSTWCSCHRTEPDLAILMTDRLQHAPAAALCICNAAPWITLTKPIELARLGRPFQRAPQRLRDAAEHRHLNACAQGGVTTRTAELQARAGPA